MNATWKIIIGNIKAAKADKARCARECSSIRSGSFYDLHKVYDYTIEAKVIAKLVETKSSHFSNGFCAKMNSGAELSGKQSYALACAFNEIDITFGDVKKAIADAGYDINENFMFED